MKNNILAFIIIIIAILLSSCTKEIKFKGDQIEPKLVINGLMEPGKPITVNAGKSVFFLDNNSNTQAPDDIVATLYVNGNRIGEMTPHFDTVPDHGWYLPDMNIYQLNKVFTHDYCPVIGDVVSIKASAKGFDDVEASTSALPNRVPWSFGQYQTLFWETNWNTYYGDYEEDTVWMIDGKLELIIEVTDPNPGKTDYFKIHLENDKYTNYDDANSFYIEYDDPVFGNTLSNSDFIDLNLQTKPEGVFTDMLFDGKSYQIKMPMWVMISLSDYTDRDFVQVPFYLEHLSKEYYYYLNTCEQVDEYLQFFTEPIQTYSNVEGGFGIVGGRTVDTLWFTLPLKH